MKGILADINIQGHWMVLLSRLNSAAWQGIWNSLNLQVHTFESLELPRDISDAVLWHTCQQQEIVLLTANRNEEDPDSLEATIRNHNTANSLPVLTLADSEQIWHSRAYADRIVEKLLDYLMYIDNVQGTGRLFLP